MTESAIKPHSMYDVVELTDAQLADEAELYGGLADAVRRLAQASLRTTVDTDTIRRATAAVEEVAIELEAEQIEGSFGVSLNRSGKGRAYGNAVVGLRNPVAVPLEIHQDPSGRASASFHLNALYEGPPGLVHGGVTALILDQVLGEAASAGGSPGMTGTLTLRYVRGTPLGACSAEAWIDRREGVKTFVKGVMRNADGEDTVLADGVFILPRWARKALDEGGTTPRVFE
jgi:acyl-coenzyme A thioesterase PaaI-like protein